MVKLLFLAIFSSVAMADVSDIIDAKSKQYGVDANLIRSVIETESGFNAKAISKAGAGGIMQLMPDTAKRFGVYDRFDVEQNIDGGVHYLRVLLDMFNGNTKLAVAGYNAGENAVIKYGYKIPPYQETQDYVRKVLANYSSKETKIVLEVAQSENYSFGESPSNFGKAKSTFLATD